MALDWTRNLVDATIGALVKRIDRLVDSIDKREPKLQKLEDLGVVLATGVSGTLVPHGETKAVPRHAEVVPTGSAASSAVITRGEITASHVRFYTTATVSSGVLKVYL